MSVGGGGALSSIQRKRTTDVQMRTFLRARVRITLPSGVQTLVFGGIGSSDDTDTVSMAASLRTETGPPSARMPLFSTGATTKSAGYFAGLVPNRRKTK